MKYSRIASYVVNTPWAILQEKLTAIMDLLQFKAEGGVLSEAEIAELKAATRPATRARAGAVAVLPLVGVIHARANIMTETSGGVSAERFGATFRQALSMPDVGAIVLDVDSPGGTVAGIEEVAQEIYKARGQKPIVAVANSLAASAAYWIASQADELVVSPSSLVGSIGVVAMHQDFSEMEKAAGVKTTLISFGKFKTEGNEFEPLTEEAQEAIQQRVNEAGRLFVNAVARGRGVDASAVRNGFGQGRVVGAKEAVDLGMADRVGTLNETIRRLGGRGMAENGIAASAVADTESWAYEAEDGPLDSVSDDQQEVEGSVHEVDHERERRARRHRLLTR